MNYYLACILFGDGKQIYRLVEAKTENSAEEILEQWLINEDIYYTETSILGNINEKSG